MGNKIFTILFLCASLMACQNSGERSEFRYNRDRETILIVNADDAGMQKDCDRAIFELLDTKKIQTLSVMVPGPTFQNVVEEIKKRNLSVGVHLTLTNEWQEECAWSPVLSKDLVPSLYNSKGHMWESVEELTKNATLKDIRSELIAQITTAQRMGLSITHIDAHMLFWHKSKKIRKLYYELAREYNLVVIPQEYFKSRRKQRKTTTKLLKKGVKTPNIFEMFYTPNDSQERRASQYVSFLKTLQPGVTHLAIHPAYSTEENHFMHDQEMRADDFIFWRNLNHQSYIDDKNIVLRDYTWMGISDE